MTIFYSYGDYFKDTVKNEYQVKLNYPQFRRHLRLFTPEQVLIKSMQAQVKQAQQRVKAECLRQQQVKLNQARAAVSKSA
jgi:hypothetical protein